MYCSMGAHKTNLAWGVLPSTQIHVQRGWKGQKKKKTRQRVQSACHCSPAVYTPWNGSQRNINYHTLCRLVCGDVHNTCFRRVYSLIHSTQEHLLGTSVPTCAVAVKCCSFPDHLLIMVLCNMGSGLEGTETRYTDWELCLLPSGVFC